MNILKRGVLRVRDSRFKRKESYLLSRKLLKFPEEQTPSKRGPFMHKKVFPYRSSRSQNRAKLLRKTIVSSHATPKIVRPLLSPHLHIYFHDDNIYHFSSRGRWNILDLYFFVDRRYYILSTFWQHPSESDSIIVKSNFVESIHFEFV